MTMRTVLDKLQTTTIAEAFLPYEHHPDTICQYVQGLLAEHAPIVPSDFSSLKKIHEQGALSDELKEQIFFLCIKAGIIDFTDDEDISSPELSPISHEQQRSILSTIELLPIGDRTAETLETIAILFQDLTDSYGAVLEQIHLIPENQRANILEVTSSPLGIEGSGIEKAFKLKFFILLSEAHQSRDNWSMVEGFVEDFFESKEEDGTEMELIVIALEEIYKEIKGYSIEDRAEKIRAKYLT